MITEEEKKSVGTVVREELVWVEKEYEKDKMDPWLNGYRTALRTVLREANRDLPKEEERAEEKAWIDSENRRVLKEVGRLFLLNC